MLEPGSCLFRWQLTLLFSLFFLWGAANNLNDVLIRQFTKAFALSNVRASLVQTCANTYVPGYLYCTYGYAYQRHGAACSRGAEHVTYGYGYQPRVCRTYHVPWHHRCRRAFTAATSAARSPPPGSRGGAASASSSSWGSVSSRQAPAYGLTLSLSFSPSRSPSLSPSPSLGVSPSQNPCPSFSLSLSLNPTLVPPRRAALLPSLI